MIFFRQTDIAERKQELQRINDINLSNQEKVLFDLNENNIYSLLLNCTNHIISFASMETLSILNVSQQNRKDYIKCFDFD